MINKALILVVDIGNSNVVFGLFKDSKCVKTWRTNTVRHETEQYYQMHLREYFLEADLSPNDIEAIVMSSVVPDLTQPFMNLLKAMRNDKFLVLDNKLYNQLKVVTDNPYEMGTDLMANAIAAYDLWQENTIIIDFGTALTFTWVKETGEIGGVNIVPGIKTAIKALSVNAAQLHAVQLEMPKDVMGKTTNEAIQAGVLIGYRGLIQHMLDTIQSTIGMKCKTIATGGLSNIIPELEFDLVDRELTLKGLNWVANHILLKKDQ